MITNCPSCFSENIKDVGVIPQSSFFAGNLLKNILPNCKLYKCLACSLYFKLPRLEKQELDKLYEEGNPQNWQYDLKKRKDWQLAINWVNKYFEEGFILDIGCWDGQFLKSLKDINNKWDINRIEINSVASKKASERGIKIVSKNINETDKLLNQFDVVTSFDLIEHVENPLALLKTMVNLVRDNGIIIISSGNTETLTWKVSGSRYWYCAIPEHISFINKKWCEYAADKLNLKIEKIKGFSHSGELTFISIFLGSVKSIIYLMLPFLLTRLRKIKHFVFRKNNITLNNYPPTWWWFDDHLIVIFRKEK